MQVSLILICKLFLRLKQLATELMTVFLICIKIAVDVSKLNVQGSVGHHGLTKQIYSVVAVYSCKPNPAYQKVHKQGYKIYKASSIPISLHNERDGALYVYNPLSSLFCVLFGTPFLHVSLLFLHFFW